MKSRTNLFSFFIFFAVLFILSGCEKESSETMEVIGQVSLYEGETIQVNIAEGDWGYEISSLDPQVATASVRNSTITIEGIKDGDTRILLTDALGQFRAMDVVVGIRPVKIKIRLTGEESSLYIIQDLGLDYEEVENKDGTTEITIRTRGTMLSEFDFYLTEHISTASLQKRVLEILPSRQQEITKIYKEDEPTHFFICNLFNVYGYMIYLDINKYEDESGEMITEITGQYIKDQHES